MSTESAPTAASDNGPVLCLGEALIDIVHRPSTDGPVEVSEHVGGSLLNVACGLARLGVITELAAWWGADRHGEMLAEAAESAGVQIVAGTASAVRTPTALATLDHQGQATYTFDLDWQVPPLGDLDRVRHLHTGSLGLTVEPGGTQVMATLEAVRGRATVSYDPNARPSIMGSPELVVGRIEAAVRAADLVKSSDEDLAWLYPGEPLEQVVDQWIDQGPAMVVVTRGEHGAYARLAADPEAHAVPQVAVSVADTVGAGDSFMAGLISGLIDLGLLGDRAAAERLRGATFEQVSPALTRAITTAGITVTHHGAYAPRRDELAARLSLGRE